MAEDRGPGGGTNAPLESVGTKELFIKVDADTVPVPHNLLRLLSELHATLGPAQPYLFGMAACRVRAFALCHAAGGAGYGMSRAALTELDAYSSANYRRDYLSRVDQFTYGGEDVAVAFALKKQAGVAVLNCGCLYQHSPLKYQKLHAKGVDWVPWPLSTTPATFHKFKDAGELLAFFRCALYDQHGRPRPAPRSLFTPLNGSTYSRAGDTDLGETPRHCDDGSLGHELVQPPNVQHVSDVHEAGVTHV